MRKLFAFLLILGCLGSVFALGDKTSVLDVLEPVQVCLVAKEKLDEEDVNCIECGNMFFNYCSKETAKKLIQKQDFDAIECYCMDKTYVQIKKLLQIQEVTKEKYGKLVVYTGYTSKFDGHVVVDGRNVNVQIAVSDERVVVGFPLILTGY
ncbi:MAG: YwmB family TATA-box binding protein [Clostridia bacterium]|nr:YwmB family TATA-box binding protein [Clostridia bacterium]